MSKVVRIHQTGGPEVLRIEQLSVAQPGPGEIRVRVLPSLGLGEYGVYAEQAIVPAHCVLPAPPALTPVEAASI